jgi:hypothetical protein
MAGKRVLLRRGNFDAGHKVWVGLRLWSLEDTVCNVEDIETYIIGKVSFLQ